MKRLIAAAVSSVLLLAVVAAAKFCLEHHLAPQNSGLQGELNSQRIEVVFLGSSHMRQSYDIAQLQKETGKSAFIISYNGLDAASMRLVLDEMLSRLDNHPKLVILDGYCELYAHAPDIEDDRFFFDSPPHMKLAILQNLIHERGSAGNGAWKDVWEITVNRGSDTILTWPVVHGALDTLSYRGGYRNKFVAGVTPQEFSRFHLRLAASSVNPEQQSSLEEMVKLLKANNIGVLLVDSPMPGPVERDATVVQLKNQIQNSAKTLGIDYYDGAFEFPTEDPSLFGDANHLSSSGRSLYTHLFAEMIRNRYSHLDLATNAPLGSY